MIEHLKRAVRRAVFGRARLQPFYRFLFRAGLAGMNYGPTDLAETGELALLDRLASQWRTRRPVIFDGGANIGDYALAVLDRFEEVELHCFEPSPEARAVLKARLRASPAHVHDFGLGEREETRVLYGDSAGSGLASVHRRRLEHYGLESQAQEEARLRRLDHVVEELGIEKIDLLKLDLEGHELAALRGAGTLLEEQRIESVQFEFGGTDIDARVFFQDLWYLLAPHYRIYRIVRDGLVEIPGYREIYEVFVGSNYFCVLRGAR